MGSYEKRKKFALFPSCSFVERGGKGGWTGKGGKMENRLDVWPWGGACLFWLMCCVCGVGPGQCAIDPQHNSYGNSVPRGGPLRVSSLPEKKEPQSFGVQRQPRVSGPAPLRDGGQQSSRVQSSERRREGGGKLQNYRNASATQKAQKLYCGVNVRRASGGKGSFTNAVSAFLCTGDWGMLSAYAQRQLSIVEKEFILQQVKEFMGEENAEELAHLPVDTLPETVEELLRAVDSGSFNQMAQARGLQTFVPGPAGALREAGGQASPLELALRKDLSEVLKGLDWGTQPDLPESMENARSQTPPPVPLQKKPGEFPESRQAEEALPLPPVAFQETQSAVDVPFEFVGW